MLSFVLRLILEQTQKTSLAIIYLISSLLVIVLPSLNWTSDIVAIKICLAIIASALGMDTLIRVFEAIHPVEKLRIKSFYSNRKESYDSWIEQLRKVNDTLIISGATAQVIIKQADEIKDIVLGRKGRVIILVPKISDLSMLDFYGQLIGATGGSQPGKILQGGTDFVQTTYDALLEELRQKLSCPEKHVMLVEHDRGLPFGITMYDPHVRYRGVVRVELYGPIAAHRPSFDITREINPVLYTLIGELMTEQLGFNPVERKPLPQDIERLKSKISSP